MGEYLFTEEGRIQAFRTAPGIVNLIADVQNGAFCAGVAAGLAGEDGMLANAARLALYDGEDAVHLALVINGRLAIGTFESLLDLKVGDNVRLVVSQTDEGPLFIHAILRTGDQILWTPISIALTRRGWILHSLKWNGSCLIFVWLMFFLCNIFDKDAPRTETAILMQIFLPILVMAVVMLMSTIGVIDLGDRAEDIFRALEVPKLERFRIRPYSLGELHFKDDPDAYKKTYIFCFSEALAAHKKRLNL